MKIRTKLVIAFLVCGLAPLIIASFLACNSGKHGMTAVEEFGSEALKHASYNELVSLRDVKKHQIEQYFTERQGDMGVLIDIVETLRKEAFDKLAAISSVRRQTIEDYFHERKGDVEVLTRNKDIHAACTVFSQYLTDNATADDADLDVSTDAYKQLWSRHSPDLVHYQETYGYFDLFIISAAHGHVLFTTTREADLGTNLESGKYKNSALAELWRDVTNRSGIHITDMEPYAPSNGDPAMFVGGPIHDEAGELVGVVAVQIANDHINEIMQVRAGMGETGECYLVGPDKLMRSDSMLDPVNRNVRTSLNGNVRENGVDTVAIREALAGHTDSKVILDYNNNPVLSNYGPFKIDEFNWVGLCEINVSEAFCPKDRQGEYFFKKYIDKYGYYDLFLINPDGYCFYSVCRESDYQTNFVNGKYSASNLGRLVRRVLDTREFGFVDFEPYAPSNGIGVKLSG